MFGWLFNHGYQDGYDAGSEWAKQSDESASENTILNVWEDVVTGDPEEFVAGWQNAERDSEHGVVWKLFFGG